MGPTEGKVLVIDMVSQSKLNTIKNQNFEVKLKKNGSSILGVTLSGLPLRQSIRS